VSAANGATNDPASETDWSGSVKFLYLLGLIDRAVQRLLQKQLAPHGLSLPDYSALSALLLRPGMSNADLARRALVTPQSMNEVVARLERRGFIERSNHPDHGRILMAVVTDAGRAMFEQADADVKTVTDALLQDIPPDDLPVVRGHLLSVLGRLRNFEDAL
jgi:DNA-binding MarR family transcriptional regulator